MPTMTMPVEPVTSPYDINLTVEIPKGSPTAYVYIDQVEVGDFAKIISKLDLDFMARHGRLPERSRCSIMIVTKEAERLFPDDRRVAWQEDGVNLIGVLYERSAEPGTNRGRDCLYSLREIR